MIELSATVESIGTQQNYITSLGVNTSKNNIADNITSLLNEKKVGSNPFLLGASKLGSSAVLTSKVDYYIGKVASNSNGVFYSPYVITISGNNLNSIVIRFDTYNEQHPTTIIVNGRFYNNNSAIFRIGSLNNVSQVTIQIPNWNTPYYPLRVQGIYSELIIADATNLLSLKSTINQRGDLTKPSFGVLSNVGNLSIIDKDGDILFYIEQRLLRDREVTVYISNTETGASQQIGVYKTDKWAYDNYKRTVSVTIQDYLMEWQSIAVPKLVWQDKPWTALQIYEYLVSKTPTSFKFADLSTKTYNLLNYIFIEYPHLEADTLWNEWQKLCELCGAYIYSNNNNEIVFMIDETANEEPIIISSKNTFDIKDQKILDNQINTVSIKNNNISIANGDVLAQDLNFTFYEYDYETQTMIERWNNTQYTNGYTFTKTTETIQGTTYSYITATIQLKIGKDCIIKTAEFVDGLHLTSHILSRKTRYLDCIPLSNGGYEYDKEYEVNDTEISPRIISYDKENNIITLKYSVEIEESIQRLATFVLSEELSLIGDYLVTEAVNETYSKIPDGDKQKSYTLKSNELITNKTKINGQKISKYLANTVIDDNVNGKEYATITCAINDYYDSQNNVVVAKDGSKKMAFKLNDIVKPLIRNASGQDIPMAVEPNGTTKVFQTLGSEIYYDGVTMQKISILEWGGGRKDVAIYKPEPDKDDDKGNNQGNTGDNQGNTGDNQGNTGDNQGNTGDNGENKTDPVDPDPPTPPTPTTQYTVFFNMGGHGTQTATQTVIAGGFATEPTTPTAEGWSFDGWYKESSCINEFIFTANPINANTIVYAKWNRVIDTIQYNLWVKDTPVSDNGNTVTTVAYFIGTAPTLSIGDEVIYREVSAQVTEVMHTGNKVNYYIAYPKYSVWDNDKEANTSILGIVYSVRVVKN